MGEMTQEEINVSLFDELKEARKTIEQLQTDNALLRGKLQVVRHAVAYIPPEEKDDCD